MAAQRFAGAWSVWVYLIPLVLCCVSGCGKGDKKTIVTMWHQMVPGERVILHEAIDRFEALHPEIEIRALYKETEELRSGFQAASLSPSCPELVYGPSDTVGAFQQMGVIADLSEFFTESELNDFLPNALTYLPSLKRAGRRDLLQIGDRVGNHLALVYNRNYIKTPPQTTDELIELAQQQTLDTDGDGRTDRYGLVWNYHEPFFFVPFLTGFGGWVFEDDQPTVPNLQTQSNIDACQFVLDLRNRYQVIPANCDYESADALFKSGRAAMIINGDWSWSDYLSNSSIDAVVCPLPTVSSTGLPLSPMVAAKGYSLSQVASEPARSAAIQFVRFMISVETQTRFVTALKTLPARRALLADQQLMNDPTLVASINQMERCRPMPAVAELRAIWDSMRPPYQELLGGGVAPDTAVAEMQERALAGVAEMNEELTPGWAAALIRWGGWVVLVGFVWWQRGRVVEFASDWKTNRIAYIMAAPALALIFLTIVYPFFYNIVLSFSNMSLRHFQDWDVVGFQNYGKVLRDQKLIPVFFKTIVWTGVNVFFHVTIGVLLAVTLNGPVRGKSIYRVLLILPWAVPAYITALTWKGMFDFEYGAVNLIISKYLQMPMVNWLGDPLNAFVACISTNVWLGFPFMMVIALGGLQGIPKELYEAARMDRVSRWMQFRHITLPMLMPVMLPAITLGAVWTFNNLNVIWLVSDGGRPSDQTHIMVSYVYKAVFNLYRYGYGAALSMLIFLVLLTCSVLFLKQTKAVDGI